MTIIQTDTEKKNSTPEKKPFKLENYMFGIELFKWVIGSVALVVMTLIIDKGFKERTAGIQEMQAYDKYVDVILKADNIEERWKLSEYYSTVTPTDRLRCRWIAYKDSIKKDYIEYRRLQKEEFELLKLKNAILLKNRVSDVDNRLIDIHNQKAPFEKKLSNSDGYNSAQEWEKQGFNYLLNNDIENAISAFRNSENAQNSFHQVYEIAKYLNDNKSKLTSNSSKDWKIAFNNIATNFSWGMPLEIKNKLLERSK